MHLEACSGVTDLAMDVQGSDKLLGQVASGDGMQSVLKGSRRTVLMLRP